MIRIIYRRCSQLQEARFLHLKSPMIIACPIVDNLLFAFILSYLKKTKERQNQKDLFIKNNQLAYYLAFNF